MSKLHFCVALISCALLTGCETTPQREVAAQLPRDPVRAAMEDGNRAYSAGDDAKALALYLPLARSGNGQAQIRIARIYTRNKGVTPNENEACNWWEQATSSNDSTAAVNLGLCFETGVGRAQSHAQSVQWYRKAADGGNAYGMYNLGLAYEYGRGVAQSFDVAADWFRKALAVKMEPGDNVDAQRHLKRCENNIGAARGDPQAQYDLAIDLMNGHKPEVKDERRAMVMMREAATRSNNPDAWFIYGSWVHGGMGGVKYDLAQAAVWIKKAADAGHEQATIRYAEIVLCGIGVKKDLVASQRILRQAIDRGSWMAMGTLSHWYESGDCGFRKDAALSAEWRAKGEAAQLAATEKRIRK
jgi:uncharacterized protein